MDPIQLAEQALREHEQLNVNIKALIKCVRADHGTRCERWNEQCAESFRHFHTQLRRHIETEELDGFMKPVCERRPTLSPVVDGLLQDHHDLLAECAEIEERFYQLKNPSEQDCARMAQDVMSLVAKLERHEAAENNLILDAFNLDLGAGD